MRDVFLQRIFTIDPLVVEQPFRSLKIVRGNLEKRYYFFGVNDRGIKSRLHAFMKKNTV